MIVGGRDAWRFADGPEGARHGRDRGRRAGAARRAGTSRTTRRSRCRRAWPRPACASASPTAAAALAPRTRATCRSTPAWPPRSGSSRDEALKSVTLYPAQILGVGDRLGSIEPGKIADLQITDGDPLEVRDALRAGVHRRPADSHGEPADAAVPEVRLAAARIRTRGRAENRGTMALNQPLLTEWDMEMAGTRKSLERVPWDKAGWKPHPRSWSLGQLATHVARLPGWAKETLDAGLARPRGRELRRAGEDRRVVRRPGCGVRAECRGRPRRDRRHGRCRVHEALEPEARRHGVIHTAQDRGAAQLRVQPRRPSPRPAGRLPAHAGRAGSRAVRARAPTRGACSRGFAPRDTGKRDVHCGVPFRVRRYVSCTGLLYDPPPWCRRGRRSSSATEWFEESGRSWRGTS